MSNQRNVGMIALVVALVAVPGLLCLAFVAVGAAFGLVGYGTANDPDVIYAPVEEAPEWLEEEPPPAREDPGLGGFPEEDHELGRLGGPADGEGTIGLGNVGTIGVPEEDTGGSGYGRGAGGLRGHSARVPRVRTGNADVRGSLSREVIRRVIRRHINEVRFCYEQQLIQDPDLEGRVTVAFIISPTGAVQSASVRASTLNDSRVESCIVQAVRRWTFPAPDGGGVVAVNYPFVLSSAG